MYLCDPSDSGGNTTHMSNKGDFSWDPYRPFLWGLILFSLYLAYLILHPFIHDIVLGILLAALFSPVKRFLMRIFQGRENLVAFIGTAAIVLLLLLPVFFFASALIKQSISSLDRINEWVAADNPQKLMNHPWMVSGVAWVREHFGALNIADTDLRSALLQVSRKLGSFLLSEGSGLIQGAVGLVFHFMVTLFITFYFIRDGERLVRMIRNLSPLHEEQERNIIDKVKAVARSALLGSFLTALCQGAAGGIALAIVGIPALFWGSLMGFASLIPVVGTALVWFPAVGYLILIGQWKYGIFLGVWCIVVVGSIDNFLRPFLMRGEGGMSPFYVFLAIIGGVGYFGLAGILYGPMILGFAAVMLSLYQAEYR